MSLIHKSAGALRRGDCGTLKETRSEDEVAAGDEQKADGGRLCGGVKRASNTRRAAIAAPKRTRTEWVSCGEL